MVKCKWCGMESKDPLVCEWCKRPIGQTSSTPSPPAPSPPSTTPAQPGGTSPPWASASPASAPIATPLGPPAARPVPPPTYTSPTASVKILYEFEQGLPFWMRLERFLGLMMPLAAIMVGLIAYRPAWYWWLVLIFHLLMGLALPVTRVIKFLDDTDYRDTALVVVFSLCLCGPTATFVLYGLTALLLSAILKVEANLTVLGLLLAYVIFDSILVAPLLLMAMSDLSLLLFRPLFIDYLNFGVLAAFVGWFMGSFFRPETL